MVNKGWKLTGNPPAMLSRETLFTPACKLILPVNVNLLLS